MFFPLHFPLCFSREPNKKQKEILQIENLLPTPTTHPWQCSPPRNSKQQSQPKSTIISLLHLPIKPSRVIPVWPNMLTYSRVEESHCHVVAIHQTWLFASHCHVVTIHWGLSPPLQVQPKFGFYVGDIIDWLCIDSLQGPRKKNPATNCIQFPPDLSHLISCPQFEMYFILNLLCDFFLKFLVLHVWLPRKDLWMFQFF